MGGESKTTKQTAQTQQTNPYSWAQQPLNSVLGKLGGLQTGPTSAQTNAFDQMVAMGQAGNPYAGGISNVANQMLSGGPDRTGIGLAGYNQYQTQMAPTAQGDYLDPNKNPFFGATTSGIYDKAMEGLNKSYAAAGVSPTGAGSYGMRMGETVTDALAPYFMNQYNTERTNQLGAIQGQYNAGNTTAGLLSGLDAQRFGTMGAGINASNSANEAAAWGPQMAINAEAARWGIAPEQYAKIMGITMPAAQAFGTTTSTGTQTGTQEKSGSETFKDWATGFGSIAPKVSFTGKLPGF